MSENRYAWAKWISEIQAIAQNGLTYGKDPFDKERYQRLQELAAEIASQHTNHQQEYIHNLFMAETGYATPKIDVKGAVFSENKILLVQEKSDGLWTLPGGFADINESPSEAVVREIYEEAGINIKAIKLLALYDRQRHDHPQKWPHIYKCIFLCEMISPMKIDGNDFNLETIAIGFFAVDNLPPLSLNRITTKQIQHIFVHKKNPNWPTDFD